MEGVNANPTAYSSAEAPYFTYALAWMTACLRRGLMPRFGPYV